MALALTPFSLRAQPRTETPAACTVSGSPETSGCHHCEPAPLGETAIGARLRQPEQVRHVFGRDRGAVAHALLAVWIVAAAAGVRIEQAAAEPRQVDVGGVLVLDLDQAALAAAVAQRFPLLAGHRGERLCLPEGELVGGLRLLEGVGAAHCGACSTSLAIVTSRRKKPLGAAADRHGVPDVDVATDLYRLHLCSGLHAAPTARAKCGQQTEHQ